MYYILAPVRSVTNSLHRIHYYFLCSDIKAVSSKFTQSAILFKSLFDWNSTREESICLKIKGNSSSKRGNTEITLSIRLESLLYVVEGQPSIASQATSSHIRRISSISIPIAPKIQQWYVFAKMVEYTAKKKHCFHHQYVKENTS